MATPDVLSPAQKATLAGAIRKMEADGLPAPEIKRLASLWIERESVAPSPLGEELARKIGLPSGPPVNVRRLLPSKKPVLLPLPKPPAQPKTIEEAAVYQDRVRAYLQEKKRVEQINFTRKWGSTVEPTTDIESTSPRSEGLPESFINPPGARKVPTAQTSAQAVVRQTLGDPYRTVQGKVLPGLQQGAGRIGAPDTENIRNPQARKAAQQFIGSLTGAPGSVEELLINAGLAVGLPLVGRALPILKAALKRGDAAFDAAMDALKITEAQKSAFKQEFVIQKAKAKAQARAEGQKPAPKGRESKGPRDLRNAYDPNSKALPANASGPQYEVAPIGKAPQAPPAKTSTAPKAGEAPKVGKELWDMGAEDLDARLQARYRVSGTGTSWRLEHYIDGQWRQLPSGTGTARKRGEASSFFSSREAAERALEKRFLAPEREALVRRQRLFKVRSDVQSGKLSADVYNRDYAAEFGPIERFLKKDTTPPTPPPKTPEAPLKAEGFETRKLGQGYTGMTPEEIAAAQKRLGTKPPAAPVVETPSAPKRTFTGTLEGFLPNKGPKVEIGQPPKAVQGAPKRVSEVEGPQVGQRSANATTNALRNSMDLDSLKSAKKETTEQWFDEAHKKGIPNKALSIAVRILDDKSPFSKKRLDDVETAGMAARLDELDQQFKMTDEKNVEELQRIVDEVDKITQATRKAGTEWGREGVARQAWFKSDYSEGGLLRRFVAEGGGKNEALKAKALGQDIAKREAGLTKDKAQAGFYTTRGSRLKSDIRQSRAEAISRIKENWKSMGTTIPKNKQAGAINLDPKQLAKIKDDVLILVKSYIQEGAVSLGEVIPKVRAYLKANEIELSDESIQRILAGEYEKSSRTLSAEAEILKNLRKEAKSTVGAQRAVLERRIREQEARIRNLPGATPQTKVPFDKSLRDKEIELMARKVEADTMVAELRRQRLAASRSAIDKTYHEIADITRSAVASSDLSAPFNQGMFALAGHPIASAKAGRDMIKALKSEDAVNRLIAETRVSKHYSEGVAAGLEIHGTRLGRGEEFFTSQIINNLPIISHSERAYTAYLNKLRMDMFSNLVESQEKARFFGIVKAKKLTLEDLKATAEYVNTVTGVGTGKIANHMKGINKEFPAMFAPGYMVSRWKTAAGTPFINAAIRKNPRLAAAIMKDYAAFVGMAGGTLYSAKLAGLDVDIDWNSDKFGKIIAGSVELDPFGSILGPIRLMNKARKAPQAIPVAGGFYFAGKASPVARAGLDLAKGENYDKKPVGFANWNEAWNLAKGGLPIMVQQQWELTDAEGLNEEQKAALRLLTILGLNINVKDQPAKGR